MAGPEKSTSALTASSWKKFKSDTREPFVFQYPEWLVSLTVENSKKTGVPLDALAQQMKTYDQPHYSPFPSVREEAKMQASGQQQVRARIRNIKSADSTTWTASRDLRDQEREMRRQAKLERRKHMRNADVQSSAGALAQQELPSNGHPSPTSDGPAVVTIGSEYPTLPLPEWYTTISDHGFGMKQFNKHPKNFQTQAHIALNSMKGCMERCEKPDLSTASRAELFEELRDHVHKAEVLLRIDKFVLYKCKMLNAKIGLPRIFEGTVDFPWDLKADAYQLYLRWRMEVFEVNLLRGIITAKANSRGADSIDKSYKGRMSAKFYGQGHLVPGQWWPTQLTAVRDGAHGSSQGGIFGEKGRGAYSIVLSGMGSSKYGDKDHGDEIWYSGTESTDGIVTENTLRLIETCDTVKNQVRVLRSSQLNKQNPYRPEMGLRYDGLYQVMGKQLSNEKTKNFTFYLVRSDGQFPIRCAATGCEENARRPTKFEIEVATRLKLDGC